MSDLHFTAYFEWIRGKSPVPCAFVISILPTVCAIVRSAPLYRCQVLQLCATVQALSCVFFSVCQVLFLCLVVRVSALYLRALVSYSTAMMLSSPCTSVLWSGSKSVF